MDLRQVKCLVALVEEGSITNAARRLNLVQPAVSMQLRKLESEFGVILFDRTARGVELSQKARGLYDICLRILEQFEAADRVMKSKLDGQPQRLRIGALHSGSFSLIPGVVDDIYHQNPALSIFTREGYNSTLLDLLSKGELDVAIVSAIRQNERLRHIHLGVERMLVVGRKNAEMDSMKLFPATQLEKYQVVMSANLRRRFSNDLARAGIKLRPSLEVESASGIFGMLRHPDWRTILPASALCGASSDDLSAVPISEPSMLRPLWVVLSAEREIDATTHGFIAAVRKCLKSSPFCSVSETETQPFATSAGRAEEAVETGWSKLTLAHSRWGEADLDKALLALDAKHDLSADLTSGNDLHHDDPA